MSDSNRLTTILANHQPVVSVYTSDGSGVQKILPADSRRWYVRFKAATVKPFAAVFPFMPSGSYPVDTGESESMVYEFPKHPAIVTGEFYINSTLVGTTVLIEQDLYIGR